MSSYLINSLHVDASEESVSQLLGKTNDKARSHKLLPGGKRTPPLMRLASHPTKEDLILWKQMHQNPFFNRNRIVTDEDLSRGLHYVTKKPKITTMPSPYLILKPNSIYKTRKMNEKINFMTKKDNFNHLPKKSMYSDPSKNKSLSKDTVFTPARFEPFPPKPELKLTFEQVTDQVASRPLLRRPLVPIWRNAESVGGDSSMSLLLDQTDLEQWRKCSLTTVCKDDPLDPDNFYHKHYPLLLKKVPKRFKGEGGSDGYDEMYRPMSKSPDIDMRYFYIIAHTSLSEEITIPPRD